MFSDADQRLAELAASHNGVFTFQDAHAAGLSNDSVERRQRHWHRLYRGVFLAPGAPLTPRAQLRAACLAGAPHAAVSHRSAAAIYGVPGARSDVAELTCPRWLRTVQPNLIVHESTRINPDDVRTINGLSVMRPERVLIELASIYKSADFIEAVLHEMRRKRLVTIESSTATFLRLARRGRPGVAITRQVLERWDASLAPPESPPETALLQILRDAGLGRVVPQLVVRDAAGLFIARVDIGLPDMRATVEYDSDQEHSDELSLARDNARRNRLVAAGWFPLVARRADVRAGAEQLIAALRALRRSQPA